MTLAEALNSVEASTGVEEGRLYLVDGEGDELLTVDKYTVLQTNAGPDVRCEDGVFWVGATAGTHEVFTALYDPIKYLWLEPMPKPEPAELLLYQFEENPLEPNAVCVFAYFEGTPTADELLKVQQEKCEGCEGKYDTPTLEQNVVSERAKLQRWCLWY